MRLFARAARFVTIDEATAAATIAPVAQPGEIDRRTRWLALSAPFAWLLGSVVAPRMGFWPAFGATAVGLGGLAVVLQRSPMPSSFAPPGRVVRALVWGAVGGVVLAAVARWLYPLAARLAPWIARDTTSLYRSFAALTPLQAALALPPIIFGEELIWRGLLHDAVLARLRPWLAVLGGAALYAVVDVPTGSPVLVMLAFGCGLGWHLLRVLTGGVLAPIVAHLVFDVLVLLIHPVQDGFRP